MPTCLRTSGKGAFSCAQDRTLRVAGCSYREIEQLLGLTYTRVNRHVTDGRQALRRADAAAEAEVEAAVREAA